MDKRYQVFQSSTFLDLREERQRVMHALLELDCIPAGMELFPASDRDVWTTIKHVIDESDYYLVIVGGRYGSVGPDGMSYTEREYRYALKSGKPTIAFLHDDPSSLPPDKRDKDPGLHDRLLRFRRLCEKKTCKFWSTPDNLAAAVSPSLIKLQRTNPGVGWVRADLRVSDRVAQEYIKGLAASDDVRSVLFMAHA